MNILYLCDEYPPTLSGGVGSSVKVIAEAMQRKGNNVYVTGLYPSFRKIDAAYKIENGVKVWKQSYFPIQSGFLSKGIINKLLSSYLKYRFLKYQKFLDQIIREYNIQIVEIPDYQEIFSDTYSKFIRYDFKIPFVIKTHGSYSYINELKQIPINPGLYLKEKELYADCRAIICLSRYSKSVSLRLYGNQNEPKMYIIPHGLVFGGITRTVTFEKINIIFAGSLTVTKGVFQLIKAWNLLMKKSCRNDIILDIYGKYTESVLSALKALVDLEFIGSVIFHGHVNKDTLDHAFQNGYLTVLPSYFETFGMVAIESMSYGCPVIFTNRASGPEIVQDGINGFLIDPDNPEQIADRIFALIKDTALRETMSVQAVNSVVTNYNIDKIAEQHLDLYQKVIK